MEALCIYLKRFAYPCRYSDIMPRFGRDILQLSMISNLIMNFIYENHKHCLENLAQDLFSPLNLQLYAGSVNAKGTPFHNCWGFIDGTVRPICRPQEMQRVVYSGHKRVHTIKFQSVVISDGIIANLHGPVEGCCNGSGMLAYSGLLQQLEQHSYNLYEEPMCLYGDSAYLLRVHLQRPFANPTPDQLIYNKAMSQSRVAAE